MSRFRMARTLCLAGAAAAGVTAVDAVCTELDDLSVVRAEAETARRDGFGAKAVIHPKHVAVVNEAFRPSRAELAWAQKVLNAFAAEPSAGAVRLDGRMIDKPHARAARAILAAARPRN